MLLATARQPEIDANGVSLGESIGDVADSRVNFRVRTFFKFSPGSQTCLSFAPG